MIIICFDGCMGCRSRIRARSPACWPSSAWRTKLALPMANLVRLISGGHAASRWCSVARNHYLAGRMDGRADPEYRRKFYEELLPEMMRAGKTIVVITHDDRYLDELHLPARRIRMEEGRIVEERTMGGDGVPMRSG